MIYSWHPCDLPAIRCQPTPPNVAGGRQPPYFTVSSSSVGSWGTSWITYSLLKCFHSRVISASRAGGDGVMVPWVGVPLRKSATLVSPVIPDKDCSVVA